MTWWRQVFGLSIQMMLKKRIKTMKSRYDNNPGKDAAMQNTRQKRLEAEHSMNDNFVKSQQAKLSKYAGRAPKMKAEMMEFDAYMTNDGMHAQELAVKLTAGLDKVAFPVKGGQRDDS
jgi:hypothetical protein